MICFICEASCCVLLVFVHSWKVVMYPSSFVLNFSDFLVILSGQGPGEHDIYSRPLLFLFLFSIFCCGWVVKDDQIGATRCVLEVSQN
mmetsp:Transcript_7766/g.16879  ORF Transcript_7766/g.16879 Transcript_7766/m.16879 type:complete len:88 (+) Transcript_7766:816-1079(+)